MWFILNIQVKCSYTAEYTGVEGKVRMNNVLYVHNIKKLETQYCYCFSFEVLDNLL